MEFELYHNADKCKDHDEYNTNLPPKDSVGNVNFAQQSVDINPMMIPVVDPPLRKRLRCSPAQLNNDVTIDISDAEDDATILDKHESGLSRVSQSSQLDSIKGKSIVNPQLRTKAKSTAFLASNYCRTLPTKVESSLTQEKLLTSPSPNMRVAKMTKTGDATLFSVRRRLPAQSTSVPCLTSKVKGHCYQYPNNQMEKSRYYNARIKAFCASIEDPNETMINVDDTIVTREEIACLAPGRPISDKIIKLVVMKTTWDQANKTFWMLPPSFAVEHFMRHSLDKMIATYIYRFRPVAPDLKFIYVPIKEESDHWYLMVISLLDEKLYDDQVEPRQEIMKSLVRCP
ncbi:uncharacterized protein DS421_8g253090 [Arachis hypogaea]|nr:uncharacterized protein DS421_8g253090 [Arachis hypogaea]